MNTNMSTTDRMLRIAAGIALVILFYTGILAGTPGIIGLVVAVVFLGTALLGNCPLYSLIGVCTYSGED
ncbi:DUF2892 domain-containing protein [Neolewinella aurantiaca]|uniref:DUF2892 domain-containing protein n=1 Tax=Neolewinella aurantiaca TaxID=2602767 RepID=A0A5C7FK65_9BACT|nr:DUF2892 domain-containing protein [Neolewinella aurantiaca]TXF90261.1 DUF2892 domain-containing protein [Neolewinella aurantiaca]